jgi:hypothetical protein
MRASVVGVVFWVIIASSCIKKDVVIALPPKTGSTFEQLNMGSTYDTTYFYNLEEGKVVAKCVQNTWDIAFDCRSNGQNVLMNASKLTRGYNTQQTTINLITTIPGIAPEDWGYDASRHIQDSTFIRNWTGPTGESKRHVYLLRQGSGSKMSYYKLILQSVSATQYVLQYDTITGTSAKTLVIGKDSSTNFVYFNLHTGQQVQVEPSRQTWDLQFTRYCNPFYELTPFIAYSVTGVLTNPSGVKSAQDTSGSLSFNNFTEQAAAQWSLTGYTDNIGYNWKDLPDITQPYITKPNFLYLVETRNKQLYKLHFVDYYLTGISGAPKFEFERFK